MDSAPIRRSPSSALQLPVVFGPQTIRNVQCPYCNRVVETHIIKRKGILTHLLALAMCFAGCCCLMWLPYVRDSCQNKEHYCLSCGRLLGVYYAI